MRRKITMLFAALLCIGAAWAQTLPATNKSYTVVAEGHSSGAKPGWAINNEATKMVSFGNTDIANEAQKEFAFVQHEGKVYLYSVWAKKFVNKDMNLTDALPIDDIKVENVEGGKYYFKYDDSHNMNIGGSKQLAPDGWSTKDGGNQYTLTIVKEELDLTEALKILNNSVVITYEFVYEGKVRYTQKTEVAPGAAYPDCNISLPFGVTAAAKPEGQVSEAETIQIALNVALPFAYAESYEAIEANQSWYYLMFHATQKNYLYYNGTNDVLDATKTSVDVDNKDAYTWAFVGNPFDGFKVVNRLAGTSKQLNASANGAVVGTAAHTFQLTSSTHGTNGFFMASSNGENTQRLNKQGGKVVYWSGADAGSTFMVEIRPMGPVAELEALVEVANELLGKVNGNIGTQIGEYAQATANTLDAAITTAKGKGNSATAEDVNTLQAAIDAVSVILPTAGKYYQFHSALAAFSETKAVYSNGSAPAWKTLNDGDLSFYWEAVAVDGGIVFKNVADGKYMVGAAGQSQAWTMSETPTAESKVNVKIFDKAANVRGYEYGVILNNWQMHCNGHGEGAGTASNIVSWNTDNPNSASAWYIVEVSNPAEEIKANLAALKTTAEDVKSELEVLVSTAPVNEAIAALSGAIAEATAVAGSTNLDELNAAIRTMNAAITMTQNLVFHGGALASLEDGEYIVYYEDAEGNKHYLANEKLSKRAVISDSPMVYDITLGNTNGYVSYAYYLDMNGSRLSNPTNDDDQIVQVEPEGSNNYNGNRVWDSQVLYVNAEGKYAIRSTNCVPGSGWKSDCFITVSEEESRVDVVGQNVDLSDALYMWNVVKASEANIAFELTIDEYKYTTLFLNYAVSVPAGVKAYAVSGIENDVLALDEVGNVIPENTPVIIEAEVGNYAFTYAAPVATYEGDNMLKGSWFPFNISPTAGYDAYVKALKDKDAVMGKAMLNEYGQFICRAHEAYLEVAQEEAKEFFFIKEKMIYALTFVVDNEVYQVDSLSCGEAIIIPEAPVKEGYTFSGWTKIPETMPAGDVTISGTFTINEYLVTFKIGDEVIAADSLEYGAAIVAPEAPVKEGYTFDGWGEVAETVPAGDVTYEGSYSVNSYLLTYTVDGDTIQTDSVAYGTVIALIEEPVKEGHTFSGWSEAPETMPAGDVTISGTFTANEYLVTFKIGDEVIAADSLEYGAAIVAPEAPEKEGYTFNGWGEVAETMPAGDVTYKGSYSVNSYLLTYTVDGDTLQTDSVAYGTVIALIEAPVKEGYTFSGWSEAPETMPAHDVTISGTFLEEIKKFLVTFKIGEEIIAADSLEYGAAIVIPEAPEKEGYTFDGWGEVAETMPAGDVTYEGSYSVNSYLLTYTVDGDTIQADSVAYGTVIALIEEPVKEGHTFSGWSEAPETMPAADVTISGTFTTNEYLVTFKIGDEVIAADSLEYGAAIVAPEAPEKEGYTFDGWGEVAETVPAGDVTYEGTYSVNSYLLTYTVDGDTIQADSVAYGTAITVIEEPVKEGYTFSGWSETPETMPASDVTISGTFTINKYLVTFKIGDEVIAADSLEYGAAIVAPEAPVKEGYTFDGWGEVAETVPAGDVTYEGSYSVNSYLLTYSVDGDTIQADSVAYGTAITVIEEPVKEGYTFSGWSETPETMPASDVTISGTFTINKYLVTFKIGDEVIAADSLEYGAAIVAPEAPVKEGYTFDGWGEVAETVPAGDVTYEGSYTVNIYKVYYYVGDELVHTEEVAYGEAMPEYVYEPTIEGDVFMGWVGETYDTMPAHDVTYTANIESGIDQSTIDNSQLTIYHLNGRRVVNIEHIKGGIYIVNGKKVMIK